VGPVSHKCFNLEIGDKIGVRGPFGTQWPLEAAKGKDVLIMAGGVGIAPLRPLIESIANERYLYKRVNVLYGSRNPHSILFHTDVISWQSDPLINFQVTVDQSQRNWRGNVGVVTSLLNLGSFNPADTVAYVCGPEIMMRFSVYALIDAGVAEENIYVSMERNMKCGIGHCGHCQWGPLFVCKDGPVFSYPDIKTYLTINEL
jgi:NAD(P)H-flavin reductase